MKPIKRKEDIDMNQSTELDEIVKKLKELSIIRDEYYNHLTKAIESDPDNPQYYLKRAEFNYNNGFYMEAIDDYTKAIKINPNDPKLYLKRSEFYSAIDDYQNAINDYSKAIEFEPENADYYLGRAGFYSDKRMYEEAITDYSKAIELAPKDASNYWMRGLSYENIEDCDNAIKDFSKAIKLDSNHGSFYSSRAGIYSKMGKYNDAIRDYSKVIEIYPKDSTYYGLRGKIYFYLENYDNALKDFSKAIELEPQNANYYIYRAEIYENIFCYQDVLKDYTKAIELEPDNADFYENRAFFYGCLLDNKEESINDYTKAIELKPQGTSDLYINRGSIYEKMNTLGFALNDYSKAIELNPDNEKVYFYRAEIYKKQGKYSEAEHDYNKAIEIDPNYGEALAKRGDLYSDKFKDYSKAYNDFSKSINSWEYAIDEKYHLKALEVSELKNEQEKEQARLDERNKVIADLSHSIKNLIATVIDPLENLKNETVVQPHIIQNALRGANLIREIVNAVNLSFKGSMDDFIYDAQHNAAKDIVNLESMLIESLRQSVGNMFDSKYFGNFMRKYFPKKEQYHEAKAGWTSISQSKDLKSLEQFLKSYFFETDFSFENAKSFAIGNEKGSAVKLLILFQELILNAVKYSAFVSKEKRFLRIRFISNADTISVKVENPFDERTKTKTTGIGHVVIQNFATLLNTEPVISKENSIYCVVIQFENLWKGNAQ